MRLLILGGPGAGKGTQSQNLHESLGIPWVSTGAILRQAIVEGSELGQTAQNYVDKGELVPDPVMIQLIRQRVLQADAATGWLLDGYPRTAFQAEELDFLLDDLQQRLDWAIWLEVPASVLMERSMARSRADDTPEIIQRRISLYYECTTPILDYYDYRKRLIRVNGNQTIEQVQQEIQQALQ